MSYFPSKGRKLFVDLFSSSENVEANTENEEWIAVSKDFKGFTFA